MQQEADQQEALSVRYVDRALVVRLSSGAWAVFDGVGAGGSLQIVEGLPALEQAILVAQFSAKVEYERGMEAEGRQAGPLSLQASKLPEEMGL